MEKGIEERPSPKKDNIIINFEAVKRSLALEQKWKESGQANNTTSFKLALVKFLNSEYIKGK